MEYAVYAGVAAAGAAVYQGYKARQAPAELADMPEISVFSLLASFMRGEAYDEQFDRLYRPLLEEHGHARIWMRTRWEVVVGNPKHIREILAQAEKFLKRPPGGDPALRNLLAFKFFGSSNIAGTDGDEWRRHRKVANPAFKKQWETKMFGECGLELIDKLEEAGGAPVIVHTQFQRLTLDALGRGIFSYDFEAVKKGEKSHYLTLYNEIMGAAFNPIYFMIPILESIVPTRQYYHKRNDEFRQFLAGIIAQRRKELDEGIDSNDLLSLMIKASNSEEESQKLSDEEVLNDLALFFLAGHDTTANTLTSTFYYLARHPEIQQKARNEVLDAVGDNGELVVPTIEQLKLMPYINCIIKESMRIITTAVQLRRYCNETVTLSGGLVIPANTNVVVHNWAAHHDPDVFPEPEKFNPDRFSELHGVEDQTWMAFGSGSRMCKYFSPFSLF